MKRTRVFMITLAAVFAALTAVLSQISIPIGPVPINLALLSVFTAGGLLGAKYGAASQIGYVILGAIGLPVFAGFTAGPGIIFGPTGGFIWGYVLAALLIGLAVDLFGTTIPTLSLSMIVALIVVYLLGCTWFVFGHQYTMQQALSYCVIPFMLPDMIKIAGACALVNRLYPELKKIHPR